MCKIQDQQFKRVTLIHIKEKGYPQIAQNFLSGNREGGTPAELYPTESLFNMCWKGKTEEVETKIIFTKTRQLE